jgi:uncharacterized protein (DUF433 family)
MAALSGDYTEAMEYVEQRNGGYYVAGTRVSLDSVVYAWLRGESSIGIVESFPSLSLNQVNGAVAYYEAHREAVDSYLEQEAIEFEKMRQEARAKDPAFYDKMEAAKHASTGRRR